jgi:hypothetical protein
MGGQDDGAIEETQIDLAVFQDMIERAWRRRAGYRGVLLQRTMHSGYSPAAPTNKATHSLTNNTNANDFLIVRSVNFAGNNNVAAVLSAVSKTLLGSSLGTVNHMLPDHAAGPGLHYYADTATGITADFVPGITQVGFWSHEYPIAVLPPGFNLAIQLSVGAVALGVGFLWEYVKPEELDDWLKE